MKSVLLTVFVLLLCYTARAQQRSLQSLVGIWEAVRTNNDGGGLEVVDSANLYLLFGDQKKKISTYKADFTQSPARFDFTVKDSADSLTLKSLMEFINNDLIKWQVFEGDVQPVHFVSGTGDMVYLRRKK